MPPHTIVSDSPFIALSARLTGQVDVPSEVELKEKAKDKVKGDKPKDPKPDKPKKKVHHKSRKDWSDSDNNDLKQKKRQHSPSLVKQYHSTSSKISETLVSSHATSAQDVPKPPATVKSTSVPSSSSLEPSLQTFTKPSNRHGTSASAGSSFTSQNFPAYCTSAEAFPQSQEQYRESFPLSFTGPPKGDDIPLSEAHDFEEYSGSVSESEEVTESSPDKQEITE